MAGVHALGGNEKLLSDFVAVRIAEVDNGEWCTTARIMNDIFDNSLDISITLGVVDGSELGSTLPALGVRRKNREKWVVLFVPSVRVLDRGKLFRHS